MCAGIEFGVGAPEGGPRFNEGRGGGPPEEEDEEAVVAAAVEEEEEGGRGGMCCPGRGAWEWRSFDWPLRSCAGGAPTTAVPFVTAYR